MPQCLSTHSTPMTTPHKLKLKPNILFSNFILTFTWTAFFPVAAAEPDPDPPPPDFASLFILLVFFTELLPLDLVVADIPVRQWQLTEARKGSLPYSMLVDSKAVLLTPST